MPSEATSSNTQGALLPEVAKIEDVLHMLKTSRMDTRVLDKYLCWNQFTPIPKRMDCIQANAIHDPGPFNYQPDSNNPAALLLDLVVVYDNTNYPRLRPWLGLYGTQGRPALKCRRQFRKNQVIGYWDCFDHTTLGMGFQFACGSEGPLSRSPLCAACENKSPCPIRNAICKPDGAVIALNTIKVGSEIILDQTEIKHLNVFPDQEQETVTAKVDPLA